MRSILERELTVFVAVVFSQAGARRELESYWREVKNGHRGEEGKGREKLP